MTEAQEALKRLMVRLSAECRRLKYAIRCGSRTGANVGQLQREYMKMKIHAFNVSSWRRRGSNFLAGHVSGFNWYMSNFTSLRAMYKEAQDDH